MSPDSQDRNSPRLLDQVRELIRIRHYSIRTEHAYVQWVKRFILFHNKRHPLEMEGYTDPRYIYRYPLREWDQIRAPEFTKQLTPQCQLRARRCGINRV